MAAPAPAPAPEEQEQPKKSGNGLMIVLIVLVVVLIIAVAGLAFMMMSQKGGEHKEEHAEAPKEEPYKPQDLGKAYSPSYKQFPAPAPGSPPQFFDMDQLVVNFKGEGKAKHLAIKMKMMTNFPEVVAELGIIKPILVNDISAALRKKTYTEMNADDAQEKLAEELLAIVRKDLEAQKVYPDLLDKILLERFVMQ